MNLCLTVFILLIQARHCPLFNQSREVDALEIVDETFQLIESFSSQFRIVSDLLLSA